jgi:hypothetical protein
MNINADLLTNDELIIICALGMKVITLSSIRSGPLYSYDPLVCDPDLMRLIKRFRVCTKWYNDGVEALIYPKGFTFIKPISEVFREDFDLNKAVTECVAHRLLRLKSFKNIVFNKSQDTGKSIIETKNTDYLCNNRHS